MNLLHFDNVWDTQTYQSSINILKYHSLLTTLVWIKYLFSGQSKLRALFDKIEELCASYDMTLNWLGDSIDKNLFCWYNTTLIINTTSTKLILSQTEFIAIGKYYHILRNIWQFWSIHVNKNVDIDNLINKCAQTLVDVPVNLLQLPWQWKVNIVLGRVYQDYFYFFY